METTTERYTTHHSTSAEGSTKQSSPALSTLSVSTSETTTEGNSGGLTSTVHSTSKAISTRQTTAHTSGFTTEESPTSEKVPVLTTDSLLPCSQFDGVILYKSSCYWIVSNQSPQWDAEAYCGLFFGSSLVSIESEGEQLFLESSVSSVNNYWIGLLYRPSEQQFFWSSSEPFFYENINVNHQSADRNFLDLKSDSCFFLDRTNGFAWTPRSCNATHFFICERTNAEYEEVTTHPSTAEDTTTDITTELTTTEEATTQVLTGCDAKPCLNGGTCAEFGESFFCRCEIGYGGSICEEDLTPDFDPALSQEVQIEDLVPENHLMINPYYVLGLYHFPLLVSEEDVKGEKWKYENLFHFTSLGEDENTRGRENVGVYPVWPIETSFDEDFISDFSQGSPSVSFADFTVWDRYLNAFEAHRFLGMESDQFKMVMEADYYWSLDAYVRRDHLTLLRANNSVASTTTIETDDLTSRKVVSGRNGKGYALEISENTVQWLQLGMHEGSCLSNPELCPDGLTVATWMKLNVSKAKDFHCLLSSGGQSSRGVALYLFGENLRAVLADGGREWITEISLENVSSWTHLAISWKRSVGMFFYLNGDLKAADWVGFRRIRPSDLDFGLTVGRRNDFLGDFAHLTLADVAVWFHVIHPWQAREVFGFPENPLFAEADISWDAMRLLSGDFKHISSIRREQSYGEPAVGVRYKEEQGSISLSSEFASLVLAVPKSLPSIDCLDDIEHCVDGVSLSVWMNIGSEVSKWWPNGIFQIISGRKGFAVQLTQHGLFVSLSLSGIRRDYRVSVLNVPVMRWFNLVITWSLYEDLAVYIDGVAMTFDSINEVVVDNLGTDFFLVQSNELRVEVQLHNIAVWKKYYYPKKIWQLVGVSESLLSCIHLGAYCWSFDEPSSLMFPYQISETGVQQVDNQYSDGTALMTDGTLSGEIILGDFHGECPHIPSLCEEGFSVSLWIKPVQVRDKRVTHLISLGADVSGEVGFFISQTKDKITGVVCNGTVTWQGTIPGVNITYDEWMYIAMLWIPESGLLLVVNGHVISSQSTPVPDERASQEVGTLVIGGRSRNRRWQASYEEVMLLIPRGGESLPSPEYFTGSGGSVEGYASADGYFDLTDPDSSVEAVDTTLTEDRFSNEDGAADTSKNEVKDFGYVTVGDFPFHCLSDPAMCHPAGLTISLWLKIGPIDHFLDPTTNSEGVGYILSSGAQNDNAHGYLAHYNGTHVVTQVKDGIRLWTVSVQYIFGQNWTNYALGWNEADGLNVFLDGEVKGTMKDGIILSTPHVEDEFTELQLGKRNDGEDGYLGAAFDDVAIWIYTFRPDDPEVSKTLKGEETKEEEIVVTEDHEELIKQAPLTWKTDCQVIHEADCARDINELLEIVNDQEEFTLNATKSIFGRMLNLTTGKTFPDSTEIKASIQVMDTMSEAGLPPGIEEDDATRIYESFAESVSNLLEDEFSYLWQNISERQFGVAALMENLETLGVQVATVLPVTDKYTGCSRMFRKNRLVTCMDRFPIESFGQEEAVLPPPATHNTNGTNSTVEGLYNFTDSITLPKNLFRFAKSGDIGSFVFSHFDNLQDVILSNMSDELPVQYTGDATVNSRILSLAIDPPLRRDLYNPVVIALEYHQQFDNNTMKTVCAFWNFTQNFNTRGSWDTNGCELMSSTDTHIFCSCNHLTHFAIVSSPIIPVVPNPHHPRIAFMGLALFIVNIFFLLHLVITFIRHQRLHTLRNSIHLQQCLAVFILGLGVVLTTVGRNSQAICNIGAMLFQYAALAVLIWITVEALQLAEDSYKGLEVTEKKNFSQCDDRLKIYYATAWGNCYIMCLPTLVVATTVAAGIQPHHQLGSGICFLTPLDGILWAFYLPFIVGIVAFWRKDTVLHNLNTNPPHRSSVIATCLLTGYYFFAWAFGSKGLYGEVMWIQYIFVFMLTFLVSV
ncbi:Adhesion G protein-coupled receptor L3 [Holothuria leucospilota]|uniref:Adhesion G protein-coupled receptor L3 n=1 Tax=Holothuria leucospilota TaxID=206669 RepID=A0A9Q1HDK8_HOLLE|nr:Adhesion G protein-coupled receptor L3 [Holothuria leucospilota]